MRGLLALWRAKGEESTSRPRCERAADDPRFHGGRCVPSDPGAARKRPLTRAALVAVRGLLPAQAAMAWHDLFEATGEAGFEPHYGRAVRGPGHDAGFPSGRTGPGESDGPAARVLLFPGGPASVAGAAECCARRWGGIGPRGGELRDIAPVFERSDVARNCCGCGSTRTGRAWRRGPRGGGRGGGRSRPSSSLNTPTRGSRRLLVRPQGGELLPYVNPVSTAFARQALDMWWQY